MSYDLFDPQQENEYLSKAKAAGVPMGEAMAFVNKQKKQQLAQRQVGLDLGKQEVEAMKVQRDLAELSKGSTGLPKMNEFETKVVNAKLAADKALSYLEGGVSTGPLASRLSKLKETFGSPDEGTDYRAALNLATSQLFNALAGAAQSDQEIKRLETLLPNETDQEATAKRKLQMLTSMLEEQSAARGVDISSLGKGNQSPGLNLSAGQSQFGLPTESLTQSQQPERPVINAFGEIAKPGDLVYNERTSSFSKYGEGDSAKVFKKNANGSTIENPLIKFLADSEFLPIAGSIFGGLMGAGLASVGTGAAGAIAGKTMQQGLRELFDPERQDLSDMAQAVVTEGLTDALMGGVMFGVAKAGGKVIMSLGNASQAAMQTGEALAKESVEAGVKKGAKEGFISQVVKDDIMAQFTPSKTIRREAVGRNIDLAESIIKGGFGDDVVENIAKTQSNLSTNAQEFQSILGSSGKTIDSHKAVDEVVSEMTKTARSTSQKNAIQEWGNFLKTEKLSNADDLVTAYAEKMAAGQSGYKDAGDVVQNFIGQADAKLERKLRSSILDSLDGEAKSQAERLLRSQEENIFLQKMFEDAQVSGKPLSISQRIGGLTNPITAGKETIGKGVEFVARKARSTDFFKSVGSAADKLSDNTKTVMGAVIDKLPVDAIKQPKGMFGALEEVLGSKNATLGPAVIGAIKDMPPEAQTQFFNEVIKLNASSRNRIGMRNTIRLMSRLGVTFTANHINEEKPKEEAPSPMTVPNGVPQGTVASAPGLNLGAFSPEGAPLYR